MAQRASSSSSASNAAFIGYKEFTGLNTVADPLRMSPGDLRVAQNVVIDNARMIHRRRGFKRVIAGNFHSLWSDGQGVTLAVRNGDLVAIDGGYNVTTIRAGVGGNRMDYVATPGGRVYFCNGAVNGYIRNGVAMPIPPTGVKFKIPLPVGHMIEYFRGRLYVASRSPLTGGTGGGSVLYISDAEAPDRVDGISGFRQFEGNINMVRALHTGIYVSDARHTYWMAGNTPEEATLVLVADYPAIPFTDVFLKFGYVVNAEGPVQGESAMWLSPRGVCLGLDGGQFSNLTMLRFQPDGWFQNGAAIHMARGNENYYVCTNFD